MKSPHFVVDLAEIYIIGDFLANSSRILADALLILAEILRPKRAKALTKSRWQKEHVICHFVSRTYQSHLTVNPRTATGRSSTQPALRAEKNWHSEHQLGKKQFSPKFF